VCYALFRYTAFEAELAALHRCVDLIEPDRVQLNTVTRPPAESYATPIACERLEKIAAEFSPPADVISTFQGGIVPAIDGADREQILDLLRQRPCSVQDIASGLNTAPAEAAKRLESLCAEGLAQACWNTTTLYYQSVSSPAAAGPDNGQEARSEGNQSRQ
jgi:wyosine [tRNA(Phe)-imidazoG37] synthetase (radical SAM superfamily)